MVPPPVIHEKPHGVALEVMAWPISPDHASARDVLLGKGARDPNSVVLEDEDKRGGSTGLNIVLILLILGVAIGGGYQLWRVGSPQALAAKKAAREAMEQAFMEEQLSKQKKYGVLRIESNPAQAVVYKDGEKMMTKNAAGEDIVVTTPTNMLDLDISQTFQIKVELEGHDPFEFAVAPHIWTKDAATSEYKFVKMVDLTPNICEYWFLYDSKKRREVQFIEKTECTTYFDDASNQGVSVTECTCKIPPEGWTPPPGHPAAAPKSAAPGSAPKDAPKEAPKDAPKEAPKSAAP